ARNGRDAQRLAEQVRPEIAIHDIAKPLLNGIEAAAQITKLVPSTKTILLSMYSDEDYVIRALNAGVKGYLLKDTVERDLGKAIDMVSRGKPFFSEAITQVLLGEYVRHLQKKGLKDSYDLLTGREKEVLQLLAEGKSNKEVASLLNISPLTVETHRSNLMQKLDLHNTAELVLYAVRKKIVS
ncbi:MAG: response regulator transcription factor, partial [Acidobacteria bacterium]|nr:response regulator transcription factor [Acidobacteriota bacterium]